MADESYELSPPGGRDFFMFVVDVMRMDVDFQSIVTFKPLDLSAESLAVAEQSIPTEAVHVGSVVNFTHVVMNHFVDEYVFQALFVPLHSASQPDTAPAFAVSRFGVCILTQKIQWTNCKFALRKNRIEIQPIVFVKPQLQVILRDFHISRLLIH